MRSLPSVLAAALTLALAACAVDEAELATATDELGRPPATGSLHGWTITSDVTRDVRAGTARASVTFDDGGTGGVRSGGVCLVADLDLGACETAQDCVDAAAAAGLPGNGGTAGWWHYCEAAGTPTRRCWSRPGRQANLCVVGPGARPGQTRSIEAAVAGLAGLEDRPRAWTAISCLAGGTGPDGSLVGDPAGCGRLTSYVHVLDAPVVVPPVAATR